MFHKISGETEILDTASEQNIKAFTRMIFLSSAAATNKTNEKKKKIKKTNFFHLTKNRLK